MDAGRDVQHRGPCTPYVDPNPLVALGAAFFLLS